MRLSPYGGVKAVCGLAVVVACLLCSSVFASGAFANEAWWGMTTNARPSYLPPAKEVEGKIVPGKGEVVVTAENYGDASVNGALQPIVISDVLPKGLKAIAVAAGEPLGNKPAKVECEPDLAKPTCVDERGIVPYKEIEMRIAVEVQPGAETEELVNSATISGGETAPKTISRTLHVSSETTPFGFEEWNLLPEEEGGEPDTRAGSHPFQITGSFVLRQEADTNVGTSDFEFKPHVFPAGLSKDIVTKLPPGLVGNPTPIARCTAAQFLDNANEDNTCPAESAVGVAAVTLFVGGQIGTTTFTVPIFNVEPYEGEPARFGFFIPEGNVPILLDTEVRTGEKYAITIGSYNIQQTASLLSVRTTFWGNPASPVHNRSRGWSCLEESLESNGGQGPCTAPEAPTHPPAFLTLPTNCGEQLQASTEIDEWNHVSEKQVVPTTDPMVTLTGCNSVPFAPTIEASPTTTFTASASGLNFNINFANEGLTSTEGIAQSELRETTVVLPEGLTIDPSAGVGLAGCTPQDYERETLTSAPGAGCPDESKLGTVSIETPLLSQQIDGNVFIAQPHENPFGSLVALYIVAKNPETGVLVKLAGKVTPCEAVGQKVGDVECHGLGQLITTFQENPQLPFDHFNFHFREGAQAPLITPALCGSYTTQALLAPWSEPLSVLEDSSSFTLTDDGACPAGGAPPFNPGITAGMLNNNAGAYSEMYVDLSRTDGEQEISKFSTVMPPGLSGRIAGVEQCPEADIVAARHKSGEEEEQHPSCPPGSEIGHTEVGTGVGQVLAYVPGKVYFAGPFNGHGSCTPGESGCAPFSLVSVTSAKVGPFDLGTVVLRFGLNIDPYTAQVSVSPSNSESIPTILDGIVTHVRDIKVYIDREHFTFNPTSCEKGGLSSTLNAAEGASATVSSSFQAVNCAALKFEPKVTASVSGKVSKADGTTFKLTVSKPDTQGEQADIKKFKIELPVQLPSRLTTLQKACTAAQFEANPAGCPPASSIGFMRAHTPLLPVPVEGPMYFVSHGGEAFPSLEIVLQGDGVKVILVAQTYISKQGITSSTLNTLPDVPFSTAEVELHNGPYSALTGVGNLCAPTTTTTVKKRVKVKVKVHGHVRKKTVTRKVKVSKAASLSMPTEMVSQSGYNTIEVNTPVQVTECPKAAVKKTKAKKKHKKGYKSGKKGR